MSGWYVNYYSVTRRVESRSASCLTFDGALIHARALAINGHIVRSVVGPNGTAFDAGQFRRGYKENASAKTDDINGNLVQEQDQAFDHVLDSTAPDLEEAPTPKKDGMGRAKPGRKASKKLG